MHTGEVKPDECATCGKGGDDPKACTACKMAKYRGVDCKKAHPSHEEECRSRARELFDEALFKQPVPEDCPICFLPLPVLLEEMQHQACCGKLLCFGCTHKIINSPCPFCRMRYPSSNEERNRRIEERMELGDPNAFDKLGSNYMRGTCGYPIDRKKGFGLLLKAAELGSARAHNDIGHSYSSGIGVEVDIKKAKYHCEIAAIGGIGNVDAMYNLGVFAYNAGNHTRAKKHWMVAASAGYDDALVKIRMLFLAGHVTKDEFEKALRAHKDSADETRSDQRDAAKLHPISRPT